MLRLVAILMCGCAAQSVRSFAPVAPPTTTDLAAVLCTRDGDVVARDVAGKTYPLRGQSKLAVEYPNTWSGGELARLRGRSFERSSDRGATWVTTELPMPAGAVAYGHLQPERVALVPGGVRVFVLASYMAVGNSLEDEYALLLRSDDRGATWAQVWTGPNHGPMALAGGQHAPGPELGGALAVLADGTLIATATESGAMLVSRDGGVSFTARAAATRERFTDVAVARDSTIYAVGDHGAIARSADGGATFTASPSGVTAPLSAIAACGDGSIWVVGARGTVLVSGRPATSGSRD